MSKKILDLLPGLALAVVIAIVARFLENMLPIHLIGASVIALFIGMLINHFYKSDKLKPGLKFTFKKILFIVLRKKDSTLHSTKQRTHFTISFVKYDILYFVISIVYNKFY